MSLILDALNRSRQDAEPVPGLAAQHYVEADKPSPERWRQWLPWLALFCAGLVIAWLLLERPDGNGSVAVAPTADNNHKAEPRSDIKPVGTITVGPGARARMGAIPKPPPLSNAERFAAGAGPRVVAGPPSDTNPEGTSAEPGFEITPWGTSPKVRSDIKPGGTVTVGPGARARRGAIPKPPPLSNADLFAAGAGPRVVIEPQTSSPGQLVSPGAPLPDQSEPVKQAPTETVAAQAPQRAPQIDPAVARLYERPQPQQVPASAQPAAGAETPARPVTQPAAVEAQPIDIGEVLSRAEQDLENSRLAEHSAPFLANLSQQAKDRIPTLMYQRHDYVEGSGRGQSSVVINGKTVLVGGSAAAGVRVDEILPDSVVLNHQGTQFRLRALNSWVNL